MTGPPVWLPDVLALTALIACLPGVAYLLLLALAATLPPKRAGVASGEAATRFLILIAAKDEAAVIGATVRSILDSSYPPSLREVHVVADDCRDATAARAREAGARVHERRCPDRPGKAAALSWLLARVLPAEAGDVVAVFDADTRVDARFLRVMDARFRLGAAVVQGRHVIANAGEGWLPALIGAMFTIDNRVQNVGRTNLGWSAKNMGDSICVRRDILASEGWGEGLADDADLRLRLLLRGIAIAYEPAAIGRGEAAPTWSVARAQRARWLRGTRDSALRWRRRLLVEAVRRRSGRLLDAALQGYLPAYSTLALTTSVGLGVQLLANGWMGAPFSAGVVSAWAAVAGALLLYPFWGLVLEAAPPRAYAALAMGPLFIAWRSCLALASRRRPIGWISTPHGPRASAGAARRGRAASPDGGPEPPRGQ